MKVKSYQVKKIFKKSDGKLNHILLLNGYAEIFETFCLGEATKFCQLLNTNSNNNCRYEIVTISNY